MEIDSIICSLVYIEKLIRGGTIRSGSKFWQKEKNDPDISKPKLSGRLFLTFRNWRPIVFTSMIVASKVWDDLSMWNLDFHEISEFGLLVVVLLYLARM